MKYLKIITTIIILITLTTLVSQAQSVVFEYDAAGNMVKRSGLDCEINQPDAPVVQNITTSGVFLIWANNVSITALQLKKDGGQWENIIRADPAAILGNLESCKEYTARLSYSCDGETKYSREISFFTKGCTTCDASNIEMYVVTETAITTSASLAWDIYPDAQYVVNYRKLGESSFNKYTTPIPFLVLLGLDFCTTYEFAIQLACSNGTTSNRGKILRFTTEGCQQQRLLCVGDITVPANFNDQKVLTVATRSTGKIETTSTSSENADVIVREEEWVEFKGDNIELKPGFKVERNATFKATIDPCE